jgi:O-antigen/teichoic acid export membrane protein
MEGAKDYSGRRVARNAALLIVGRLLAAPLSLLQVGMLARYFGVASYGTYIFLFSYLGIFGFLCDFGINQILVREQSKSNASLAGAWLMSGLLAKFFFGIVAFLAAIVLAPLIMPGSFSRPALYLASVLLVSAAFNALATVFDVHLHSEWIAGTNLISTLFLCLATWLAIQWHSGLLVFIALNVLFGFPSLSNVLPGIASVVSFGALSHKFQTLRWKVDLHRTCALVKESSALGISLGLVAIATRADSVLLIRLGGTEQMGFYSAVTRLTDLALVVPAFLVTSILPKFSAEFSASRDRFVRNVQRSSELVSVGGTLAFLVAFICARPLILLIFGEDFAPSAIGLKIVAMLLWLVMANGMLSTAAVSSGRQWLNLWCAAISLCSSLLLNIILIPKFGFLGSCVARVTTEFLIFLVALTYLGAVYGKSLASPVTLLGLLVIGGTVALDFLFPLQKTYASLIELFLLMALYLSCLYRLRPLSPHELRGVLRLQQ